MALARQPFLQRLSLDLENDGALDREALTSFVSQLAAELHAAGRRLTVVVDGVNHENPLRFHRLPITRPRLPPSPRTLVLAWGSRWAGSVPGRSAPLPWVARSPPTSPLCPTTPALCLPRRCTGSIESSGGHGWGSGRPGGQRCRSSGDCRPVRGHRCAAHVTGAEPLGAIVPSMRLTFAYTLPASLTYLVPGRTRAIRRPSLAAGRDRGSKAASRDWGARIRRRGLPPVPRRLASQGEAKSARQSCVDLGGQPIRQRADRSSRALRSIVAICVTFFTT